MIEFGTLSLAVLLLLVVVLVLLVAVIALFRQYRKLKTGTSLASQIDESSELEAEDREMMKSVFGFGDMITREVMVPRTDMITLDSEDTYDSALRLFIRSGYSRIPVLGENADQVLGVAYFKDIVQQLYDNGASPKTNVVEILREPLFVPESKPVDDLFRTMQSDRQHIAFAIDEYGGIAGLVTLEDTLEEIVGELDDEHDLGGAETEASEEERDQDGALLRCIVPARYLISDLEELFAVEIEHDDVDTVLGLLNKLIGRIAIRGSKASIAGISLEAISTSGRRKQVSRIEVRREDAEGE